MLEGGSLFAEGTDFLKEKIARTALFCVFLSRFRHCLEQNLDVWSISIKYFFDSFFEDVPNHKPPSSFKKIAFNGRIPLLISLRAGNFSQNELLYFFERRKNTQNNFSQTKFLLIGN